MSTTSNGRGRRTRVRAMTERAPVTTLELFFDLVLVFALTQVTDLMSDDPSARGSCAGC